MGDGGVGERSNGLPPSQPILQGLRDIADSAASEFTEELAQAWKDD